MQRVGPGQETVFCPSMFYLVRPVMLNHAVYSSVGKQNMSPYKNTYINVVCKGL